MYLSSGLPLGKPPVCFCLLFVFFSGSPCPPTRTHEKKDTKRMGKFEEKDKKIGSEIFQLYGWEIVGREWKGGDGLGGVI